MNANAISANPRAARTAGVGVARQDPAWIRWLLTGVAVTIVVVLIIIPVVNIFSEALSEGVGA